MGQKAGFSTILPMTPGWELYNKRIENLPVERKPLWEAQSILFANIAIIFISKLIMKIIRHSIPKWRIILITTEHFLGWCSWRWYFFNGSFSWVKATIARIATVMMINLIIVYLCRDPRWSHRTRWIQLDGPGPHPPRWTRHSGSSNQYGWSNHHRVVKGFYFSYLWQRHNTLWTMHPFRIYGDSC